MRHDTWIAPLAGYCRQRRADDPHLLDRELLAEITALGYRGRLAAMSHYLHRHGPARQPCTQCGSPEDRAIAWNRQACLLPPGGQLPVPVRPVAGEMIASYLRRLAAANHLPLTALISALPAWLTWRFTSHHLLPHGTRPDPRAAASLHRVAALTGAPATAIARALPLFGGGPRGPARAITACHRCAAARGITQPVPVHQAAHETVCTRHGIWLSPPGLPQLDVSACPEIITAQHRARRLLRRCTPEQLIHAQVQAASGRPPGQDTPTRQEQRAQILANANPGLPSSAGAELTRAAAYPAIIALTAEIITAARHPAPGSHQRAGSTDKNGAATSRRPDQPATRNAVRLPINPARAGQRHLTGPT